MSAPYTLADLMKYGAGYSTSGAPDPETQYFIDQGYITPGGTSEAGQTTYNYNSGAIPNLDPATAKAIGLPATPAGKSDFGSYWQPTGVSGAGYAINPKQVATDPNFGSVTRLGNIAHPEMTDFMSRIGQPLMMALLGLGMGGAISAVGGPGAGLSGLGKGLYGAAEGAMQSGKIDPLSLLGIGASAAGVPSWLTGLGKLGYGLSQGRTPNPISGALSLARLLAQMGGS